MDNTKLSKKISNFITNITKQSSKYSKLAKREFDLMMLLRKKTQKFEDLGHLVYTLVIKNVKGIEKSKQVEQIVSEIEKIEKEEARIKKNARKDFSNTPEKKTPKSPSKKTKKSRKARTKK